MTQSSGQMDAAICSKSCKKLESAQRHTGTDCHAARITGRSTSSATHAALSSRLHPCAVRSNLQNTVASTNPTMATSAIGLLFRKYLYWPLISASYVAPFLGSTYMSNEGPRDRQDQAFIGVEFLTS